MTNHCFKEAGPCDAFQKTGQQCTICKDGGAAAAFRAYCGMDTAVRDEVSDLAYDYMQQC